MQNQHQLVLATDLDGTFLEGSDEIKDFFYNKLIQLRENVLLVYVTGRPVEIVHSFCSAAYLPYPAFVIADHGTHIVDGSNFEPITILQNPIVEKWNNGQHLLKDLLQHDMGLQLQDLNPPYRLAYYYDATNLQMETLQKIDQAGYDVILSSDMYLDIVPKGVNKGSTLLNLLRLLNIQHEKVITAGDSMNDLSLFLTGLKSIAVENSEPKLVEAIKSLENVYHSPYPGIWGILDGLRFFKKHELFIR